MGSLLLWLARSTTGETCMVDNRQPVVLFVCLLVRQEDSSVAVNTQSLYFLFDIVQCSI